MRVARHVLPLVAALGLAACGEAVPAAGEDGLVATTPRALAAVVVEHVGEPRRTTGRWSDPADPLAVEAQVDYGVDPEGSEDGSSHTVHVEVTSAAAFSAEDRKWWRCRPAREEGHCEEAQVDGATLLYRWRPGYEEEEGGYYAWIRVEETQVVVVSYDESDLFDADPRTLDLVVDPDDLRAAALDPAMSLRTTAAAVAAGEELDSYEGVEQRPEMPEVVATTPEQVADRTLDYVGLEPTVVRPSRLDELGPDAVGVHLEFPAGTGYDAFTLDVLTAVGRAERIDPLPCRVQRAATAPRDACFAWDPDSAATWQLARGGKPGRMWIVGAQDDDTFNRVESVAVLVTSSALDRAPIGPTEVPLRLPETLIGDLAPFTSDLSVGPERRVQ